MQGDNNNNTQFIPSSTLVWNGMGPHYYHPIPTAAPIQSKPTETPAELLDENWSSGLYECCGKDCSCSGEDCNCCTCCLASCCGGVAMAFLLERLGITPSSCGTICLYTISDMISIRSLIQLGAISTRKSLALKLGRNESSCESCCIICCCFPCAIAQMERDVISRKYKFDTPKFNGDHQSCIDASMGCVGAISSDSYPHKIDQAQTNTTGLKAPFTQNRMLRYYIRTGVSE